MGDLVKTDAESLVERVVVQGDLAKLTPGQRAQYYARVCESLGLNPLTRPFEYIMLNGRLTLYARRDATDQLRRLHGVSVEIVSREHVDDLYIVVARATDREGRRDEAIGAVSVAGLKGEALANALMKAETKAKRRVTLSICGLGWADESEIDSIPSAAPQDLAAREITPESVARALPSAESHHEEPLQRPYAPEVLRQAFAQRIAKLSSEPATEAQRGAAVAAVERLFALTDPRKDHCTEKRHLLTGYLLGKPSSAAWTRGECQVLLRWAQEQTESGETVPSEVAAKEALGVIKAVADEAGQQPLEM